MAYDHATGLYVPVFHVLATGKAEKVYKIALQGILDAVGEKVDVSTVTCDFETALHKAAVDKFGRTTIVGCLFHWKQAIRRWLIKNGMDENEVSIAMERGCVDILTVIAHAKIETKGIPWVEKRIAARCKKAKLRFSTDIWKNFWRYFKLTWLKTFKPSVWNVHGVDVDIVNRTNNPLERYNRKLNEMFKNPHPTLAAFVGAIEKDAGEYLKDRDGIIRGFAQPPQRYLPEIPSPPRGLA